MKTSNRRLLISSTVILLLTGGLVTLGNGCSGNFKAIDLPGALDATSSAALSSAQGDYPIIPGAKTVSVAYSKQVLEQMTACTGVQRVSDSTLAMYEQKKGAISVLGAPNTITSPMMMAITSIAGEVCNDLIAQETAGPLRIFKGMTLSAATAPATADIKDAISRLSLSCWQRFETDLERQAILDLVASATNTKTSALLMCTAVLASLDSILN